MTSADSSQDDQDTTDSEVSVPGCNCGQSRLASDLSQTCSACATYASVSHLPSSAAVLSFLHVLQRSSPKFHVESGHH